MSVIPFAGGKHLSSHFLATSAAFAGSKRITAHYVQSVISIHNYFELVRLESSSELHDFLGGSGNDHGEISYQLVAGPAPEFNPYRPRIPEQLIGIGEDFYDFYEENQQIHREQHNLIQAGDTTFPFQLFITTHTDPQFKAGSVGRFYHEDLGVIIARYVRFSNMKSVSFAQCPVGLFRNADLLQWQVTNDLDLSHPNLVVGICAAFIVPEDDTYGWVIVDGPTLQEVKNDSTTAELGESFAWSATGSVSNDVAGKVIGRRVNRVKEAISLLPGQFWVRTESFSEKEIQDIIDAQVADLQAAVDALQLAIETLPAASQLATLTAAVNALSTKLNLEIAARKAVDLAIQNQLAGLNFVTQAQLDNALTTVASNLDNAVASLTAQIQEVRVIALEALALAQSFGGLAGIEAQISVILGLISDINARPRNKFPVVDGSVPPNLVYLDDGSLVYTTEI